MPFCWLIPWFCSHLISAGQTWYIMEAKAKSSHHFQTTSWSSALLFVASSKAWINTWTNKGKHWKFMKSHLQIKVSWSEHHRPLKMQVIRNCWTRKLTVITNWFYVPSCMASTMGSSTFRGNFTFLQDTPPQEILRYCNCKLPRFTFFPKLNLHSWKSPQVFGDPMFELVFLSAGSLAICSRSSMRIRASSACSRRFKIWLHHTRNANEHDTSERVASASLRIVASHRAWNLARLRSAAQNLSDDLQIRVV